MRTIAAMLVLGLTVVLGGSATADAAWPGGSGRIAFTRGGDIHTMAPDGSDVRALTDTGFDSDAAWSPDGEWLAFTSAREITRGVYIIRADGAGLRRITDGLDPSWSSDGRQLALPGRHGACGRSMSTAPNRREVLSEDALFSRPEDPEWSPDGRRIAFGAFDLRTSTRASRSDVWVVNADGTGLARAFRRRPAPSTRRRPRPRGPPTARGSQRATTPAGSMSGPSVARLASSQPTAKDRHGRRMGPGSSSIASCSRARSSRCDPMERTSQG